MSVAQPQPHPAPTTANRELTIVSHSTLFYWWPVWAVGFLLGTISLVLGKPMVIVPKDTNVVHNAKVTDLAKKETLEDREAYVLPLGAKDAPDPSLHTYEGKGFGVLFATVLILVVVVTNVPLRGMWSFMVIFLVIALSIIFGLAHWWGTILHWFDRLDIRINAGGYLYISTFLFLIWLFTLLFFDKQIYMVFTPGQFKVCTEVGGGEQVYSTIGMTLEKQRSDLFRHWILGLGSGDLIVKTTGAQAHHFEMSNVLFINRKKQQIEDMVRKIPD
jgi:hypothetical protein